VKRHHVIKGKRTEVKKALSKQEMDTMKRKTEARTVGRGGGRNAPVWESGPGGYGGGGYGSGYGQGCKFLAICLYNDLQIFPYRWWIWWWLWSEL